jgi:hypothetical protein
MVPRPRPQAATKWVMSFICNESHLLIAAKMRCAGQGVRSRKTGLRGLLSVVARGAFCRFFGPGGARDTHDLGPRTAEQLRTKD